MIYLDNNATTRMSDQVLEEMLPFLREDYGNASSIQHKLGRRAHQAVEQARERVAQALRVDTKEIFFTSGATEAINTVLKGVYQRYQAKGRHIITSPAEHKAVLTVCEQLRGEGAEVTYLSVNAQGLIDTDELKRSIREDTVLVCLMAANNETGVLAPLGDIAAICRQKDVLFFCDATQYIGKLDIDLSQEPIDMLCLSAHKFHGPKGIGALYVRRKSKPTQIASLIQGGKQEHGFRGGTYAVAPIVGLGAALKDIEQNDAEYVRELRDQFEQLVMQEIAETKVHGSEAPRLYNTSNILFKHVRGAELMTKLPDVAISSGSACVSGDRDPSHVLKAIGISDEDALCSLRFSFSKYNTREEVVEVVAKLKAAVEKLRAESPVWKMYKAGLLDEL